VGVAMSACSVNPEGKPKAILDTLPKLAGTDIGNIETGEDVFIDRNRGHCVLCHSVSGLTAEFQGNVGPDLSEVGARLTQDQIRIRIVDYERVKPDVLMPSYFRNTGLHQISDEQRGETLLSAQDIEDLVVYLSTLKQTHSVEVE